MGFWGAHFSLSSMWPFGFVQCALDGVAKNDTNLIAMLRARFSPHVIKHQSRHEPDDILFVLYTSIVFAHWHN